MRNGRFDLQLLNPVLELAPRAVLGAITSVLALLRT